MTKRDGSITVRPTPENAEYLSKQGNKNERVNLGLGLLQKYEKGELIEAGTAPDKSLTVLHKEKIGTEIELNKLRQQAMEAKKIIDQAGALKVESMQLDNQWKKYRNEKARRKLEGENSIPATPAVPTKTPSIMEFTIRCQEPNCDKEWGSLYYDDRSNPLFEMHHAIAAHLNLVHGIGSVPPDMSPFRLQQKIKEAMQGP